MMNGSKPHPNSSRTTIPGTVKLIESDGRAGAFPIWL